MAELIIKLSTLFNFLILIFIELDWVPKFWQYLSRSSLQCAKNINYCVCAKPTSFPGRVSYEATEPG